MSLHDLALKYGSDKADHGYCRFYERSLPKNPKKILEIGVLKGASLAMWAEYFPDAAIHGLDLFAENSESEIEAYLSKELGFKNIILHKGNQCNWLLLEVLLKEDFDVIIDDGSHNSRDQMMTFFGLFNGKHYFIEDIHCCREQFYRQGLPYNYSADQIFPRDDGRYNVAYDKNIVCVSDVGLSKD